MSGKPKLNGYHITPIEKGVYGEVSKIQEELDELKDAALQDSRILIMVELADLYGAIEGYAQNQGIDIEEIIKFSNITKRAFISGGRK